MQLDVFSICNSLHLTHESRTNDFQNRLLRLNIFNALLTTERMQTFSLDHELMKNLPGIINSFYLIEAHILLGIAPLLQNLYLNNTSHFLNTELTDKRLSNVVYFA